MTTPPTREFHLSDILSVTTGCLVSTRNFEGLYDILKYMKGGPLFTHQLLRASNECKPALFEQFPQLATIDASCVNGENWKDWLNEQVKSYGETLAVRPLNKGEQEHRDPIADLAEMVGADRVIPIDNASDDN